MHLLRLRFLRLPFLSCPLSINPSKPEWIDISITLCDDLGDRPREEWLKQLGSDGYKSPGKHGEGTNALGDGDVNSYRVIEIKLDVLPSNDTDNNASTSTSSNTTTTTPPLPQILIQSTQSSHFPLNLFSPTLTQNLKIAFISPSSSVNTEFGKKGFRLRARARTRAGGIRSGSLTSRGDERSSNGIGGKVEGRIKNLAIGATDNPETSTPVSPQPYCPTSSSTSSSSSSPLPSHWPLKSTLHFLSEDIHSFYPLPPQTQQPLDQDFNNGENGILVMSSISGKFNFKLKPLPTPNYLQIRSGEDSTGKKGTQQKHKQKQKATMVGEEGRINSDVKKGGDSQKKKGKGKTRIDHPNPNTIGEEGQNTYTKGKGNRKKVTNRDQDQIEATTIYNGRMKEQAVVRDPKAKVQSHYRTFHPRFNTDTLSSVSLKQNEKPETSFMSVTVRPYLDRSSSSSPSSSSSTPTPATMTTLDQEKPIKKPNVAELSPPPSPQLIQIKELTTSHFSTGTRIWDSAIGLSLFLLWNPEWITPPSFNKEIETETTAVNDNRRRGRLTVLELGSGCGLAGMIVAWILRNDHRQSEGASERSLSSIINRANIILTDGPETVDGALKENLEMNDGLMWRTSGAVGKGKNDGELGGKDIAVANLDEEEKERLADGMSGSSLDDEERKNRSFSTATNEQVLPVEDTPESPINVSIQGSNLEWGALSSEEISSFLALGETTSTSPQDNQAIDQPEPDSPSTKDRDEERYLTLLASDVLYNPSSHIFFLQTILSFFHHQNNGNSNNTISSQLLLAYRPRTEGDGEFFDMARKCCHVNNTNFNGMENGTTSSDTNSARTIVMADSDGTIVTGTRTDMGLNEVKKVMQWGQIQIWRIR